jgi:thiosulfate dehydrogenase
MLTANLGGARVGRIRGAAGRGAVWAALAWIGWLGCSIEQRSPHAAAPGDESEARSAKGETVAQALPPLPSDSDIPAGPLGLSIRRGRALLQHTRDSLPRHAGSELRCFSCHLREGTQAGALPLIGVYSRFPQYRDRNGLVNLLEDRINDCFERSLNGKALARDSREMRDLIAYFAFISRGVPPPGEYPGTGLRPMDPLPADSGRGRVIFAEVCARCHGGDGGGTPLAPAVWGPRSFNIGAGMARLRSAAAFIRDNMPNDRAVVLSDQQAFDVAAYVVSRPRPDFARKANDWPNGNPPPDVAYATRAAARRTGVPPVP